MIKDDNKLKNPITNGETKKMIRRSLFYLMVIVAMCIVALITIDETISSFMVRVSVSSTLSGVMVACSGGIIYSIKSFFETRESSEKAIHRLERQKERNRHREQKWLIKSKNKFYHSLNEKDKMEALKINKGNK